MATDASKTMASDSHGNFVVCAHTASKVATEDWDEFIGLLKKLAANQSTKRIGVLVDTIGGGPDGRQRAQMAMACEGKDSYIAVLCDSRVVRGIIMAVGWTGINIKGFPVAEIQRGMDYLEVPAAQRGTLESKLGRMLRTIGR